MNFRYYLIYFLSLFTRFFPLPTRTGILKIGNPDNQSPVLVTGNYLLTVEILKKELEGLNLFLLVADSKGINVWCAATGGHFTNHQIISILKTSGIETLVKHRSFVLPQLGATGIEPSIIKKKTGWQGKWGPVRAGDIPTFLANGQKLTQMSTVDFPLKERLEMAIVWAIPMSIIFGVLGLIISPSFAIGIVIESWILSLIIFGFFSIYDDFLQRKDLQVISPKIILEIIFIGIGITITLVITRFFFVSPPLVSYLLSGSVIILVVIIFFDMNGNTPIYKSDHHEERIFHIKLDKTACRGIGDCILVCPKNCFDMDDLNQIVTIPRAYDCVQCGACIVQCPFDALYFENKKGEILNPDTIRSYRLNLMGNRTKKIT